MHELAEPQTRAIRALKAAGFDAHWWGKGNNHAERIYLNADKQVAKVYIDFDYAPSLSNPRLEVNVRAFASLRGFAKSRRRSLMGQYADALAVVKDAASGID
jgi:hypothetical protein